MMKRLAILMLAACALTGTAAAADHSHAHHPSAPPCTDGAFTCAGSATPAFAPDGGLWLAWSAGGRVLVARSSDQGQSFTTPVTVAESGGVIDDGGEARPKIAALPDGRLVVAWTIRRDDAFNGTVMISRSVDGGRSFEAPRPLVTEASPTSQRFEILGLAPGGRLFAAWIDKANLAKAKADGQTYAGAAVAVAWSDDGGATFTQRQVLADHSCECCRVAIAFDPDGNAVLAWRHVFAPNLRDHAVTRLDADGHPGALLRVSEDEWAIDACPHHGPSLAVDTAGTIHVAWYTGGKARSGLFYAHSDGRTFSSPLAIGDPARMPSHPQIIALGGTLFLAWKEFGGDDTQVMLMRSSDGGQSWSAPRAVAATRDASDHPLLVSYGRKAFLSWLTRTEGYRLIALDGGDGR